MILQIAQLELSRVRAYSTSDPMKIDRLLIGAILLPLVACTTLELQTEFTAGRQALIRGDSTTALNYFDRVAHGDPKYGSDSPLGRESIWTYVGRAQYNSGKYNDAKEAFENDSRMRLCR